MKKQIIIIIFLTGFIILLSFLFAHAFFNSNKNSYYNGYRQGYIKGKTESSKDLDSILAQQRKILDDLKLLTPPIRHKNGN